MEQVAGRLRRAVDWLDSLADEGHKSELTAGYYHLGFAVSYVGLVSLYTIATAFHLWCARRHFRDAKMLTGEKL